MSDQSSLLASAKWWGSSLTIRGALLSAASAALPALAGAAGIDVNGETIRQLGEHTVSVVQAVGGLAGMAMTVAGRLRASTRIERRPFQLML